MDRDALGALVSSQVVGIVAVLQCFAGASVELIWGLASSPAGDAEDMRALQAMKPSVPAGHLGIILEAWRIGSRDDNAPSDTKTSR